MDMLLPRLTCLFAVSALAMQLNNTGAEKLAFALGLFHNFFAFYYSSERVLNITSSWKRLYFPIGLVLLMTFMFFLWDFKWNYPMAQWLFGLHVVLSEAHHIGHFHGGGLSSFFLLTRYLLYFAIYIAISDSGLRLHLLIEPEIMSRVLIVAILLLYIILVSKIFLEKNWGSRVAILSDTSLLFFSGVGILVGGVGFGYILIYHYLFWIVYPLLRLKQRDESPMGFLSFLAIFLTVGILLTKVGWIGDSRMGLFTAFITLTSVFHILSTFGLSKFHPKFIRSCFD